MTEQLMEDLTSEEHEALLLMSEHGIAAPLSPAAQAVLHGFRAVPTLMYGPSIAAALRAVSDQVVPEQSEPPCGEGAPWPQSYQLMADSKWEQRQKTRAELLAIAAELEAL